MPPLALTTSRKLLFPLACAGLLLAAASACASPTPTPTPTATPTPEPTPTPAPTATPEPAPVSLAPGDGASARDLLAMLTPGEEACVRAAVGDAAYDDLLAQPASAVAGAEFPFDCLSTERFAEVSVAALSQAVGGLSSESESCLRGLYAGAGESARQFPVGLSADPEAIEFGIRFFLCVTDEEAEAFSSQPGGAGLGDFFSPSDMRCIADETGVDEFVSVLTGIMRGPTEGQSQLSPDLMRSLAQIASAAQACGVDPILGGGAALPEGGSPFGAPDGDRGSFAQVKSIWLELNPETQTLIDCLEQAATAEELDDAFTSSVFPPGVAACMERHADLLPEFTTDGGGNDAAGQ